MSEIVENFYEDIISYLQFKYNSSCNDIDNLLKIHLQKLYLRIKPIKYNIYLTNAIKDNSNFKKYQNELDNIVNLFNSGDVGINNYLSRKIEELDHIDYFLLDFGFYHLHLKEKDIGRTEELLIVLINQDNVYFIDITVHDIFFKSKKIDDINYCELIWKRWMSLFQIVFSEYPILLSEYYYKLNVVARLEDDEIYTPSEYISLLRKNFTIIFNINNDKGETCCIMSMPKSTNGMPDWIFQKKSLLVKKITLRQEYILSDKCFEIIYQKTHIRYNVLKFKLTINDDYFDNLSIFEENSKLIFDFNDLIR